MSYFDISIWDFSSNAALKVEPYTQNPERLTLAKGHQRSLVKFECCLWGYGGFEVWKGVRHTAPTASNYSITLCPLKSHS